MTSLHRLSFSGDCTYNDEVPSFARRTALSAMPIVADLCGERSAMAGVLTRFDKFP